jgi:putative endonuclease
VVGVRAKDALGQYGERVAARHLADAGLTIVATNWRCADGEIDIVARERDVVVICEVKTRRTDAFGTPAEAVTRTKADRLRRLAMRWLRDNPAGGHAEVRFDVVSILLPRAGSPAVEHLRGAF